MCFKVEHGEFLGRDVKVKAPLSLQEYLNSISNLHKNGGHRV